MRRSLLVCGFCGLLALLAVNAASQGYQTQTLDVPAYSPQTFAPEQAETEPSKTAKPCAGPAVPEKPPCCCPKSSASAPACCGTESPVCTPACHPGKGAPAFSPSACCPQVMTGFCPSCCTPCCSGPTTVVVPAPAVKPTVDSLLEKLEAIKAKRAAMDQEEKETIAVLNERLEAQRERMGKLGVTGGTAGGRRPATEYGSDRPKYTPAASGETPW